MRTNQRGNALLTSVIVILVITVIGVGIIRFAGRELAGANAEAHEQAIIACAEAARQTLLAKFHLLGQKPIEVEALNMPMDSATASNARVLAIGGHYDTNSAIQSISVAQVSYLPSRTIGPSKNVRDQTNMFSAFSSQGGQPMKVVVHCQVGGDPDDPMSGRQLEVEFGIRFGL